MAPPYLQLRRLPHQALLSLQEVGAYRGDLPLSHRPNAQRCASSGHHEQEHRPDAAEPRAQQLDADAGQVRARRSSAGCGRFCGDRANLEQAPLCRCPTRVCAPKPLLWCRPRNIPRRPHDWKIRSACLKLHSRRVTALDFPPGSVNLVCSADKKGRIAVWDFEEARPHCRTRAPHACLIRACADTCALLTWTAFAT